MNFEALALLTLIYGLSRGEEYDQPFAWSLDRPAALKAKSELLASGLLEYATPETDWLVPLTAEGYAAAQVVCNSML